MTATPQPQIAPTLPHQLTERQYQIAHLTNQEIAERLYIAPSTVHTHTRKILAKLDIRSSHQIPNAITSLSESSATQPSNPLTLTLTINGLVTDISTILKLPGNL